MATFQSGPINPPTPPPSAFHAHLSDAVYKFRPGKLTHDGFLQLQHDMPLPIAVLRELWNGDPAGPKTRHLVTMIWTAFPRKPMPLESIEPLVTHPKPTAGVWPARNRTGLLTAVLEALTGVQVSQPQGTPTLVLVKKVGLLDGRHQAFWCVVPKGSTE